MTGVRSPAGDRPGSARWIAEGVRETAPQTPTAPSASSWVIAMVAVTVLGVVLPLLLVTSAVDRHLDGYTVVVLWGICLFTAARLGEFLLLRRAQLVRMSFYIFCYVFVGITPLAQICAHHFVTLAHFTSSATIDDRSTIARTATLFLVGIVAHEAAYSLSSRRVRRRHGHSASAPSEDEDPVVLNVPMVWLLCLTGILVTLIALAVSGLGPLFNSREAASAALVADSGGATGLAWYRISHTIPFAGLFLLLHLMRRGGSKRTAGYFLVAGMLVICNIIINNPLGNSRLWANTVLFALLSVFVNLRRPRAVAWVTGVLITAFLLLFPYADATRRASGLSLSFQSPLTEFSSNASFDAFHTAANGLRYVDIHGFTWGRQLLGGLLTFVPRSIWPTKPPDTGYLIDPIYNRAATIWTEMHINFGTIGVVVGLGILGLVARWCDDSFISGRRWALILVPVLFTYYFIVLRGTLSAAVSTLLPVLVVLVIPLASGKVRGTRVPPDVRAERPPSAGAAQPIPR